MDFTVSKRDKTVEPMMFDKIGQRLKMLGDFPPKLSINYSKLVIQIAKQLHDGIETQRIDELTARECAFLSTTHPDYGALAGRIVVSNNHKNTLNTLREVVSVLKARDVVRSDYHALVTGEFADMYESMIQYDRDYLLDFFGFKTLERAYLLTVDGVVMERPQHIWMRVAIELHGLDFVRVQETYDLLSLQKMTHATPTLFNSGTPRAQLSSCFLVATKADSIHGIFETLADCAAISKMAGGIGLHIHNVRAKGTHIQGTNGTSNGLVPMLKVFNETARYVDQGGGKRNGSFSIYLSPEHPDIEEWLDLKKNTGDENARARDLFYAVWVPDLFMERVEKNEEWSLFCPHKCPGLADVYGDEYATLYRQYEKEGRHNKKVAARDLWFKILDAQMETGTPSILFKDACNRKSNQKNLGTIKSSNLCTEVVQYSSPEETAVCNLASISLPAFVHDGVYDYAELHATVRIVARNLDRVIDVTYYPTESARLSNMRHRPIGIGVQGLADAFFLLDLAFYSEEATEVNKRIFETIYHAAMEMSVELAEQRGAYESFAGSPLSKGLFQFDLWGVAPTMYDWEALRVRAAKGARNSLLVAPMPTASTSQILGNNECFEPITSNIYSRRTLAGEFVVLNKYLVKELLELGKWSEEIKDSIVAKNGSVQHLDISGHLKQKYKTVWEMPMKHLVNMARDRGAFICQSQSMNLWLEEPTRGQLTSMHFYSWKQGLKTGIYYLRRKPRYQAQQVTVSCETCTA
jgi:ribonucleoside-diphosphate reductase alpha chain